MDRRELLEKFLTGEMTRETIKDSLKTSQPVIVFDGETLPEETDRPIIYFGDNG